jgi:hypothetical protein
MLDDRARGIAMIVDVYRNLHTGTWSVRAASGPDRGKVLYHPREVALTDARFVVGEKARDTVRATCSKSVHAVAAADCSAGWTIRPKRSGPCSMIFRMPT